MTILCHCIINISTVTLSGYETGIGSLRLSWKHSQSDTTPAGSGKFHLKLFMYLWQHCLPDILDQVALPVQLLDRWSCFPVDKAECLWGLFICVQMYSKTVLLVLPYHYIHLNILEFRLSCSYLTTFLNGQTNVRETIVACYLSSKYVVKFAHNDHFIGTLYRSSLLLCSSCILPLDAWSNKETFYNQKSSKQMCTC